MPRSSSSSYTSKPQPVLLAQRPLAPSSRTASATASSNNSRSATNQGSSVMVTQTAARAAQAPPSLGVLALQAAAAATGALAPPLASAARTTSGDSSPTPRAVPLAPNAMTSAPTTTGGGNLIPLAPRPTSTQYASIIERAAVAAQLTAFASTAAAEAIANPPTASIVPTKRQGKPRGPYKKKRTATALSYKKKPATTKTTTAATTNRKGGLAKQPPPSAKSTTIPSSSSNTTTKATTPFSTAPGPQLLLLPRPTIPSIQSKSTVERSTEVAKSLDVAESVSGKSLAMMIQKKQAPAQAVTNTKVVPAQQKSREQRKSRSRRAPVVLPLHTSKTSMTASAAAAAQAASNDVDDDPSLSSSGKSSTDKKKEPLPFLLPRTTTSTTLNNDSSSATAHASGSTAPSGRKNKSWSERFDELVRYKEEHGNVNVPARYGALGWWCKQQRHNRRDNKLRDDYIAQLDSLGFSWDPMEEQWENMYQELCEYKDVHGDCLVPRRRGKLGLWVGSQRIEYHKQRIRADRMARLEAVGFEWSGEKEETPKDAPQPGEIAGFMKNAERKATESIEHQPRKANSQASEPQHEPVVEHRDGTGRHKRKYETILPRPQQQRIHDIQTTTTSMDSASSRGNDGALRLQSLVAAAAVTPLAPPAMTAAATSSKAPAPSFTVPSSILEEYQAKIESLMGELERQKAANAALVDDNQTLRDANQTLKAKVDMLTAQAKGGFGGSNKKRKTKDTSPATEVGPKQLDPRGRTRAASRHVPLKG